MAITNNRRSIVVGIFILIGLAFFIAGVLAIGSLNKSFIKKIEISTVFEDVGGLQQGNNIWFSGVKIGTVKDLSFFGESQVLVVMNIDEKAQPFIHKNAKAKISSDGLIGSKIIVIYGGSATAPTVQEGDRLSVDKAYTTEDMFNTLQENNVNILAITTDFKEIGKKIMSGEGTLGKLLIDKTLYNNLLSTTQTLSEASLNAKKVTGNLNTYTAKLNQNGGLANEFVSDTMIFSSIRETVAQLNQIVANANAVVKNLEAASTDSNSPLGVMMSDDSTAQSMKATIKNLETGSEKLNENLEAMQHNFLLRGYFKDQEKEQKKEQK
ncbi:MAG: MlaD family protein [Chitinophagales bacterium]